MTWQSHSLFLFLRSRNFCNFGQVNLSNNPYKLITGSFFENTLTNGIIYGYTKIDKSWVVNRLDPKTNSVQASLVNFEELKGKIPAKVYDDLSYYDISGIAEGDQVMAINTGNTLLIFRKNGSTYAFQKQITLTDAIEFVKVLPVTDSTVILLDYKPKFIESNQAGCKGNYLNAWTSHSHAVVFSARISAFFLPEAF